MIFRPGAPASRRGERLLLVVNRSARPCSSMRMAFQYQLDYGAVSEAAEGNWSSDGTTVYLTATRMEGAYKTHNFNREPLKIEGDRLPHSLRHRHPV